MKEIKHTPEMIMILLLLAVNNFAQINEREAQMRLTLQVGLEVPTGDFSNQASSGVGANATFEYWQNTPLSFTGSVGYNHFSAAKDLPFGIDYSFTDVPILLGIRYYPSRGRFHPYLGAELGLHILTSSVTRTESRTITISETNSRFGIDPLIGFRYHLNQSTDLDFNLKYNIISTEGGNTNFLGINGGVQLGL